MLGEEARAAVLAVFNGEEWRGLLPLPYPDMLTAEITATLAPHIAVLIAQARADGEEVGRGDMEHFERLWRADERAKAVARIAAGPYRLGAYDYKHGLYVGDPDGPAEPHTPGGSLP